jgi:plasmid maintenance system antidote protein VapI
VAKKKKTRTARGEATRPAVPSEAATKLRDYFHPAGRLTQVGVADALGVSQQSVSMWLKGRSRPSPPLREALERVTGIPVQSWLTEEERSSAIELAKKFARAEKVA